MRLHAKPLDLPLGSPVQAATMCAALASPAGYGDELRAIAAALRGTAEALRSALRQLRSIAQPGSLWRGEAGRAFSAKLTEPSEVHLDEVPARYDGYAAALSSYASRVDEAHRDLAAAQSAAADAVRAYGVIVARPGAPPSAAVRDAERACLLAASQYQRGYDRWVADVNRCVDQLAVVDTTDHLHNPHGWHAAVDAAARVFGDMSTITAVLGVAALAVCPPAAPVLFATSMASSGLALGADIDRSVQFGEHVTAADLAFDAVGALPLAGAARGMRSAVRAATHAPAGASRAGVAVRAYSRTLGRAYRNDLWREPMQAVQEGKTAGGGTLRPATRPMAARFRDNLDEVGSVGASCVRNTVDHRDEGYARAAVRSPARVAWTPVADLAG
jgi:uncharacterized protein YukE